MARRDIAEMMALVLNSHGMIIVRIARLGEKIELSAKV